jgi:AraC-like DNA-binding protein
MSVATAGTGLRQRWTTADVDPRHALAWWVETICQSFLEIDIQSPEGPRFAARLDSTDLGPGSLYLVQADAQNVRRTPARIARSQGAFAFLMQLRRGQAVFRQYGRQCEMRVGDCVMVDCTEPYDLDCLGPTRSVVLRLPLDWLSAWVPSVPDTAARLFRPGEGWGGALSAALAGLDDFDAEPMALPPGTVAEQLAGLVALAAGPRAQALAPTDRRLRELRDALRARCLETGLTPSLLATDLGISRRYLHHLFARAGTTFGEELMRLRLESARRMLADGRFAGLGVAEVAERCGFNEPSHFARRFRRAFGEGPTDFRRRQRGD